MISDPDPILPFGKFKSQPCSDADVRYLDWLIGQDWLRDDLRQQILSHLKTRPDWEGLEDED